MFKYKLHAVFKLKCYRNEKIIFVHIYIKQLQRITSYIFSKCFFLFFIFIIIVEFLIFDI